MQVPTKFGLLSKQVVNITSISLLAIVIEIGLDMVMITNTPPVLYFHRKFNFHLDAKEASDNHSLNL